MESFHRVPTDPAVDRLAALRVGSTSTMAPTRPLLQLRLLIITAATVLFALVGLVLVKVNAGESSSPVAGAEVPARPAPDTQPELLAGEAVMAFPVKKGYYPSTIAAGDVIRMVVTPGTDGSGTTRFLDETVVVVDIEETSDLSSDVVLTVRGRQEILESLSASGPVHVALVRIPGEVE